MEETEEAPLPAKVLSSGGEEGAVRGLDEASVIALE
jgi:hypothetical protein